MLKWFLNRQIAKFERTWNYDASYIHEMIDGDPRAARSYTFAATRLLLVRCDDVTAITIAAITLQIALARIGVR
jgi:hypothetical protein